MRRVVVLAIVSGCTRHGAPSAEHADAAPLAASGTPPAPSVRAAVPDRGECGWTIGGAPSRPEPFDRGLALGQWVIDARIDVDGDGVRDALTTDIRPGARGCLHVIVKSAAPQGSELLSTRARSCSLAAASTDGHRDVECIHKVYTAIPGWSSARVLLRWTWDDGLYATPLASVPGLLGDDAELDLHPLHLSARMLHASEALLFPARGVSVSRPRGNGFEAGAPETPVTGHVPRGTEIGLDEETFDDSGARWFLIETPGSGTPVGWVEAANVRLLDIGRIDRSLLVGHWVNHDRLDAPAVGQRLELERRAFTDVSYTWGREQAGFSFAADGGFREYENVLCSDESDPVRYFDERWSLGADGALDVGDGRLRLRVERVDTKQLVLRVLAAR